MKLYSALITVLFLCFHEQGMRKQKRSKCAHSLSMTSDIEQIDTKRSNLLLIVASKEARDQPP